MENHKIKAVIFDLGNVLLDFDHRIAAGKISPYTDKTPDDIFNLFFDSPLTRDFECGKISPEYFFSRIKQTLKLKIGYDKFVPIWNEIFFFSEKNRAVYDLAKRLNRNLTTGLLSNINVLHFEYLKKTFPVFDVFHKVMASCELKVQKPDPFIFELAAQALGVAFTEVFYTDDRPELVDGARQLGIRAFVFQGVARLESDLKSQGVTIN
ncbi:MAG: HAD family phosphatase [Candidatus Omnitrophica bacterium]|nr:HAD family phosphatase [Candidatus Omnitrophota bacterium]